MIVRPRNPRASAPSTRGQGADLSVRGSAPETHNAVGRHRPVLSKLSDELREYLANQPRLVLIGVDGVARPFIFVPFNHGREVEHA